MPHPLLMFSQSDSLIHNVDRNSYAEWQTVQIQISWLLQKPTDLDLHCLQRQSISGFSRTRVNTSKAEHKITYWQRSNFFFFSLFFSAETGPLLFEAIVSLFNESPCLVWIVSFAIIFVCVEVLRRSQPNGVMSSAVSLTNHTFTGQA